MKKFGKKLISLLAVVSMAFSVAAMAGCGEKGDTGATGATGAQGETGAAGKDGASAWEIFKAKYLENNGTEYPGTEEEWYESIINPTHNYGDVTVINPNTLYADGLGYHECTDEDCNHAELLTLPSVSKTTLDCADSSAKATEFTYIYQNQSTAWASLEVSEANAAKQWKISISGLPAQGAVVVYDANTDQEITMAQATMISQGNFGCFFYAQFPESTQEFKVVYGGMAASTPTNATISIVEFDPTLPVGTKTVDANGAGMAYTFTATEAGNYTLTCTDDNQYLMVETSTGSESIGSPYSFTLEADESITFIMSTNDMSDDSYEVTITKN